MGNMHLKLYEIWTSGSGGDVVKRHILSRALAAPLFRGLNYLCNFGRGHHEEQLCKIILNLDHWFRRKCNFKGISGSPFVQGSITICAILVDGIMRSTIL